MPRHWILLLAGLAPLAAQPEKAKEAPPPPYVVRVLALGHEPERKFKGVEGGLFVMLPPEPDEIPPPRLYFKPPPPPAPLPAGSPLARQFERVPCEITLNGIRQVSVPSEIPREARLVIEKELPEPPVTAGGKGRPEKAYAELGVLERRPGASSALVILYNPAGAKTWNNVRANVIDTSESTIPPGSVLVYNLCREPLSAAIGAGVAGTLAPGQSALARPRIDAGGNFALRLLLDRNGEAVQLVDSERAFPPGSRAFLVIYPVPAVRNIREADFVLFVIPPDPKPEPAVAPMPPGGRPAAKPAAVR